MEPTTFERPEDFRTWLEQHHDSEHELWVGYFKKGSGKPSMTWPESVDEALCFGWIDGVRKSIDARRGMPHHPAGFDPTSRSHHKEATMSDPKTNTETVRAYYELAFNEGKPEEAVAQYLGDRYIQHNPQAADGPEAFIGFVNWYRGEYPRLQVEIKRTVAEGDLVVTHSVIKTSPEDRGTAAADIFRLEDGKIVEHWDVLQPVPETAENDNTMF